MKQFNKILLFSLVFYINTYGLQHGSSSQSIFLANFFYNNKSYQENELQSWKKSVESITQAVSQADNDSLTKEYNKVLAINDGIINTVKFVKNTSSAQEKKNLVKAFLNKKDLFGNKDPQKALDELSSKVKPGITSGKSKPARAKVESLINDLKVIIGAMKAY